MEIHNDAGLSFLDQERFRKAIAEFDEAIRLDPQSTEAHNLRGRAYIGLDQFERAIDDFDTSIRLDPESIEAYINRGTVYWDLDQYQKAIEDYDAAIRLDPQDALSYSLRGGVYAEMGQHQRLSKTTMRRSVLSPSRLCSTFEVSPTANSGSTCGLSMTSMRPFAVDPGTLRRLTTEEPLTVP